MTVISVFQLHSFFFFFLFFEQDLSQGGVQPDCSIDVSAYPISIVTEAGRPHPTRLPLPTPNQWRPECPPVRPAEVICNCQTQANQGVSSSVSGVISPAFALILLAATLCFEF